jgi:hypothetical protein
MVVIPVLHLPLMNKLRVIAPLATGGLVWIVTIVRLVWVISYQNSVDTTWTTKRTDLFTCAEITVGIICACLPSVYFFLSQRFSFLSLRGSYGGSWLQKPQICVLIFFNLESIPGDALNIASEYCHFWGAHIFASQLYRASSCVSRWPCHPRLIMLLKIHANRLLGDAPLKRHAKCEISQHNIFTATRCVDFGSSMVLTLIGSIMPRWFKSCNRSEWLLLKYSSLNLVP